MYRSLFAVALAVALPGALRGQKPVTHQTKHFEVVAASSAVARKSGRELERAAVRFEALFGEPPAFGRVTLLQRGGGAGGSSIGSLGGGGDKIKWRLAWRDPRTLRRGEGDLTTHEAAHQMFLYWVKDRVKAKARQRKDRYGTALPDWFDEAIAVWHEPTWMRRARQVQVRQGLASHFPLEKFFASEHPLAAELAANKVTQAVYMAKQQQLTMYYGQALAVLEYLVSVGGKKIVKQIAIDLAEGQTMAEVLKTRMRSSSLKTVKGFEGRWRSWVRRSYRTR